VTRQGVAVLGLPRAWDASGVAAGSRPTIHASHGFHGAATVDVGTEQGKKRTPSKPKQGGGMAGTKGQVTSSKDLSSGEKRKIVSYREEAAQTREKERKREEQKQATERKTEGERDGEKEKRRKKTEEECMSERVRESRRVKAD